MGYWEVACPSLPCWGSFLPTHKPGRGPGICSRKYLTPLYTGTQLTPQGGGRPQYPTLGPSSKRPLPHHSQACKTTFQTRTCHGCRRDIHSCFIFCLLLEITVFCFPILFSYRKLKQGAGTPHSPTPPPGQIMLSCGGPWRGQWGGRGRFLPGASTIRPAEA